MILLAIFGVGRWDPQVLAVGDQLTSSVRTLRFGVGAGSLRKSTAATVLLGSLVVADQMGVNEVIIPAIKEIQWDAPHIFVVGYTFTYVIYMYTIYIYNIYNGFKRYIPLVLFHGQGQVIVFFITVLPQNCQHMLGHDADECVGAHLQRSAPQWISNIDIVTGRQMECFLRMLSTATDFCFSQT